MDEVQLSPASVENSRKLEDSSSNSTHANMPLSGCQPRNCLWLAEPGAAGKPGAARKQAGRGRVQAPNAAPPARLLPIKAPRGALDAPGPSGSPAPMSTRAHTPHAPLPLAQNAAGAAAAGPPEPPPPPPTFADAARATPVGRPSATAQPPSTGHAPPPQGPPPLRHAAAAAGLA